jgi:hypothetical protein
MALTFAREEVNVSPRPAKSPAPSREIGGQIFRVQHIFRQGIHKIGNRTVSARMTRRTRVNFEACRQERPNQIQVHHRRSTVSMFKSLTETVQPHPPGNRLETLQHFQDRYQAPASLPTTNVPDPCLRRIKPCVSKERMASRKVARETPSCFARSGSEGRR